MTVCRYSVAEIVTAWPRALKARPAQSGLIYSSLRFGSTRPTHLRFACSCVRAPYTSIFWWRCPTSVWNHICYGRINTNVNDFLNRIAKEVSTWRVKYRLHYSIVTATNTRFRITAIGTPLRKSAATALNTTAEPHIDSYLLHGSVSVFTPDRHKKIITSLYVVWLCRIKYDISIKNNTKIIKLIRIIFNKMQVTITIYRNTVYKKFGYSNICK